MSKKKQEEVKARKVFESKYDPNMLRELIQSGKTADELLKLTGLATKTSLRAHVGKLIQSDKTFYEVEGLYTRTHNTLKAGKYGLKLSLKKLESLGDFPEGTEFTVKSASGQIILTMVSVDGAEDPVDDNLVVDLEDESKEHKG